MGYEDAEVALKEGVIHSSTSGSDAVLMWEERRKHQEPTCQTLLSLLTGNFLIDTHTNSTPCESLPQRMRSALKPTEPEHNKGCLLSSSFIDGTFSRFSHLLQEVEVLIYLLLLFSQEERLSGDPMTLRAEDFWLNTYTQHTAKKSQSCQWPRVVGPLPEWERELWTMMSSNLGSFTHSWLSSHCSIPSSNSMVEKRERIQHLNQPCISCYQL